MIRTEAYLGGRLVKEIEQMDVSSVEQLSTGDKLVDGRHIWRMDGGLIREDAALLILRHKDELDGGISDE